MSDGIPLGTIAGLPVRANWSVLVLLWLFAWSLATTLPQTVPGYHTRDYWVAGVIGAVVLLMSLLAHEATHAVVARRAGMEVYSVTLWMFGGVTRIEGEAQTPRTQFWIAFSGPLTSLLLSAIFAGAAASLRAVAAAPLAVGVVLRDALAAWGSRDDDGPARDLHMSVNNANACRVEGVADDLQALCGHRDGHRERQRLPPAVDEHHESRRRLLGRGIQAPRPPHRDGGHVHIAAGMRRTIALCEAVLRLHKY